MNEINALIWPSPDGIGVLDEEALAQTLETATGRRQILTADPADGAFRADLTEAALEGIDEDTTGDSWKANRRGHAGRRIVRPPDTRPTPLPGPPGRGVAMHPLARSGQALRDARAAGAAAERRAL